jgi:glycosyltransferase involved in cell wall biosynthesis
VKLATLANAAVVHTRRWVEHFRARGHDVRVYSLEPAWGDGAGAPGVVRLPASPLPGVFRYPLAVPPLQRELRRFGPDVVDAHFVPNYGLMGALSGFRPLSVAAWGSDLLMSTGVSRLWRDARARFTLSRAALVLCDAANLATAARRAGADPARVRAIPWGVDRALFQPAAARERGLLLSTRMHEDVYDLPTLIEGAARVLAAHPHTQLVIAGDGSRRGALERLAASRLPRSRHRFVGRLGPAELAGWLARAEVYLSASHSDSTSQSLLEAMAAGALPVVSDIEGNREWVAGETSVEMPGESMLGDARLFPPGDAAGLASAIERALADPVWGERARARNAAVIAARGDWHVNLARIEACFEALAAGRALPAYPAEPDPASPGPDLE